jgi:Zn-dependent M28 family amino/carboxypeptidase
MPRSIAFVIFTFCLTWTGFSHSVQVARGEDLAAIATRLKTDLAYISSDALAGRDVGSEGIAKAGEYIAKRFSDLGFETDKFDGGPYQEFAIPGPAALGDPEKNQLKFTGADGLPELKLEGNYCPLSLGSSGKFESEVVFVGFGITAPGLNYDDYAGLDVEGKVVIVLRREPQQSDAKSRFNGTQNTEYAYFTAKELNASLHKVAAMILVNDTQTAASPAGDAIMRVAEAGASLAKSKVPTIFCSRSVIDPLIQKSTGKSLSELQAEIDSTGEPKSVVLKDVKATGEVEISSKDIIARNVVGFLPGKGSLAEEYVVVGAHYDHVGMGGMGSLAPGTVAIHNGADDNGSGTTTMLEVARHLSLDKSENRRGIIFIAFSGEERGLLGSKHYVRSPRWPLEKTVTMVNMDMVGRLTDGGLTIYGTGTAEGFDPLLDKLNETSNFKLDKQPAGFGPSDHQSFYEFDIPVFHFFTGLHNDYHRPSDDFDKVNIEGMQQIADMVNQLVIHLATRPDRPKLLKITDVADVGRANARRRVTLGIQMDTNAEAVVVKEVSEGGGAAAAGVMPGDTIIKIGETAVANATEMRRALNSKKAGDTVEVTVKRGTEEVKLQVKLGS